MHASSKHRETISIVRILSKINVALQKQNMHVVTDCMCVCVCVCVYIFVNSAISGTDNLLCFH